MMRSLSLICIMTGLACSPQTESTTEANNSAPKADQKNKSPKVLTVYSGRSALLVEPLLQAFAKKNGIELKLRFDKSTEKLANRLVMEGTKSPADLFFAQAVGYLTLLSDKGLIEPLDQSILSQVPVKHRSASGHWVGTSGRLRVMVYSPERVRNPPRSLSELADPRFKGRVGWAPGNASLHAHIAALRHHWGEDKTASWLKAMKANKPVVYPKNSPQVRAVSSGEIDIGWVNHYYLHKLRAQDPTLKAANANFKAGDAGNLVMLAGVGIPKSSKNKELAKQLIEFLLSDEGQNYFAQKAYEYPARDGVKLHPDVRPLGNTLVQVPQAAQTDLEGSLSLLRALSIQ